MAPHDAVNMTRFVWFWCAGSSESFHYFVTHWKGKPLLSGLSWIASFSMYYGVLLCSAGIFQV